MLVGKHQNTIDASGRIIFPAPFRKVMGEKIILAKSLHENCLCAYSEAEWENLFNKLNKHPESRVKKIINWLYGSATTLNPDKQGRVFITSELIEHAGLKQNVTFVGMGSKVHVWDADSYVDMYNSLDRDEIADDISQLEI